MPLRDYEHMDLPDGITPDEARWYSQQRQQDIDIAVERTSKHLMRRALVGFLILFVGLLIAFYVNQQQYGISKDQYAANRKTAIAQRQAIVDSGRAVSVDGCNRDFNTITKLRGILITSKDFAKSAYKEGSISRDRYSRSIKFYDDQLAELRLPDCRKAKTVVNQDPKTPVRIPVPRYPGDKQSKDG